MADAEVLIRLTPAEAVVIDELLRRFSITNQFTIEDVAEKRALCNLQCVFEKAGDPNWPSLDEARATFLDSFD